MNLGPNYIHSILIRVRCNQTGFDVFAWQLIDMSTARQRPSNQERNGRNERNAEGDRGDDYIEHRPARRKPHGRGVLRRQLQGKMLFAIIGGIICLLYFWSQRGLAARAPWQKEIHLQVSW